MSARKIFRIEYILILFAAAIFTSTLVFKTKVLGRFSQFDSELLSLINQIDSLPSGFDMSEGIANPSVFQNVIALKEICVPYFYFDSSLSNQFDAMCADGVSVSALLELQNAIHLRQRKLIFGYDSSIYFSLILIALVTAYIFYARQELRLEAERIRAIVEEKAKFSRNLHDGAAQDLAAARVYVKKGDAQKISFYTERALHEVRYLIDSLHLNLEKDFTSLVSETLSAFEANWEIETSLLQTSREIEALGAEKQLALFYILQEALSNTARHSKAGRVEVKTTDAGEGCRLVIHDDGAGFSEETLSFLSGSAGISVPEPICDENGKKHRGLFNMRERVLLMGGEIEFLNGSDGGATIAITIKNIVS